MDDARDFLKAVESSSQIFAIGTQRHCTPAYIKAAEYIQSGKFGDIVMVEMSWNVNQPGRWRRPDVAPAPPQIGEHPVMGNQSEATGDGRGQVEIRSVEDSFLA